MCKNVGVCSRANKVQIITDDDAELKCPECGEEMELLPPEDPKKTGNKRWPMYAAIGAALVLIGGGTFFLTRGGDKKTVKQPTGVEQPFVGDTTQTNPTDTTNTSDATGGKEETPGKESEGNNTDNKGNDTEVKGGKANGDKGTSKPVPKKNWWSSYASFDGTTLTFKKAHRIPGTSQTAQPGDKVSGKWVDGEVNMVRWYHADGSPSETLTHD